MIKKRAQLKIQEMSFMIAGVILFFILVGLFALSILYNSLKESSRDISETKTISAIVNLADSPELSCSEESNCVDSDKAINLIGRKSYENFWDFTSLSILKYSGFNKTDSQIIKCTFSNYPDCDLIEVYDKNIKNHKIISSFVSVCRKEHENGYTYNKCEIGKLNAGYEIK